MQKGIKIPIYACICVIGGTKMLIIDKEQIGRKLLVFRKKAGLTQFEVTEKANLSDRTYADIERGHVNMRVDTLIKICEVLKITPNDILTEEDLSIEENISKLLFEIDSCSIRDKQFLLELISKFIKTR